MSDRKHMKVCARCGHTMKETDAERVGLVLFCPGCAKDYCDDAEIQELLALQAPSSC